jgi:hypothetical protein
MSMKNVAPSGIEPATNCATAYPIAAGMRDNIRTSKYRRKQNPKTKVCNAVNILYEFRIPEP